MKARRRRARRPTREPMLEMLYTGGTTRDPKGVPISHALFLDSVTGPA